MTNAAWLSLALLEAREAEELKRKLKKERGKAFSDMARRLVGKDVIIYRDWDTGERNLIIIDESVPSDVKKLLPLHTLNLSLKIYRIYDIYKYKDPKKIKPIIEKLKKEGIKTVSFKRVRKKELDEAYKKLKKITYRKLGEII